MSEENYDIETLGRLIDYILKHSELFESPHPRFKELHPKYKGRYVIANRPGSVTKYTKEFCLQEEILELNLDKSIQGWTFFFETILSIYTFEDDLDIPENKVGIGTIFGSYVEIIKPLEYKGEK